MDGVERLHWAVQSRITPEATCGLIVTALGARLLPAQRRLLHRAAASRAGRYSSMNDGFAQAVPLTHKVNTLAVLLEQDAVPGQQLVEGEARAQKLDDLAADPWRLLGELRKVAPFVGWHPGADYGSRLNRVQRDAAGIGMSRRRYNRLVRQLMRTQERAKRMGPLILLRHLEQVSRSGMATYITVQEMRADPFAAAFVAYWTAQRNRRRAATVQGRDNPFDVIAETLLGVCERRPDTDWWMIARAFPRPDVVARLDDFQRGHLIGQWMSFMRVAAGMLKGLYEKWPQRDIPPAVPDGMWKARPGLMPSREARGAKTVKTVDLATMVVRPGMDSSTWNTAAAAYNAARQGWISCLAAAGALDLLSAMCPGKAMRLLAADIAAWHRTASGSTADPQSRVWAELPLPWRVIAGDDFCSVEMVEEICDRHGVDPAGQGWTAPRPVGEVAEWKPTPELVHGVEVGEPLWAGLLRRCGVWSGKPVTDDAGDVLAAYRASSATAGSTS